MYFIQIIKLGSSSSGYQGRTQLFNLSFALLDEKIKEQKKNLCN